jgi:hypothetical protein
LADLELGKGATRTGANQKLSSIRINNGLGKRGVAFASALIWSLLEEASRESIVRC